MKVKKFNELNTDNWSQPVEILSLENGKIKTSLGEFNIGDHNVKVGYTYILKLDNDNVTEVGMSCVDLLLFVKKSNGYEILSIKRGRPPFVGMWANPGGNIDEGELPIDAAVRELEEETGVVIPKEKFEYVGKFDKPWRDPRSKYCISHAFKVILDHKPIVVPADDATDYQWTPVSMCGDVSVDMAFDHKEIIKSAIKC